VSVVHHFHNVFISHCLSKLFSGNLHLFEVDEARHIAIVKIKNFQQSFRCLTVSQSAINDLKKLFEINGSVFNLQIVQQVTNDFVSLIKTQFLQDLLYLFGIDFTTVVFVKKVKCGLELLQLWFREPLSNGNLFGL
jgi:hypothetical protein